VELSGEKNVLRFNQLSIEFDWELWVGCSSSTKAQAKVSGLAYTYCGIYAQTDDLWSVGRQIYVNSIQKRDEWEKKC
jgi:hypothetical protein